MHLSACKISCLTVAASLALWMQAGFAAREEHIFEVSVTIPTPDFYILPVESRFLERTQIMKWNLARGYLEPLQASFDVRSRSGAITARLGHESMLSNGRDLISLRVKFNGHELALTDTVVVPDNEANTGYRVPLRIEAIKPETGFKPGAYFGSVQIMFDGPTPSAAQ